jgi:hypothetical protein
VADQDCISRALLTNDTHKNKYCPKSCPEKTFKTKLKLIPIDAKNILYLFIGYGYDEIQLFEEYLIYDLFGIVSSIGGSLGLFLGFSFFQGGEYFMTKVLILWNWIRQERLQKG